MESRFEPTTPQCQPSAWNFSFQVNGITTDRHTPLFNACVSGSQDCVNLLLQHGASLHPASDLASPIHEAAKRGKSVENLSFPPLLQQTSYCCKRRDIFKGSLLSVGSWDQKHQPGLAGGGRFLAPTPDALTQQLWGGAQPSVFCLASIQVILKHTKFGKHPVRASGMLFTAVVLEQGRAHGRLSIKICGMHC